MNRVQRNAAGAKPIGNLFYVRFAIGVIEVLAGGEDLHCLHTVTDEPVENAGMQPLFHQQVG